MVVWALLCLSCGFACQQRVLKAFPDPGYLHFEDGVVWLWHSLVNLYIYIYIYIGFFNKVWLGFPRNFEYIKRTWWLPNALDVNCSLELTHFEPGIHFHSIWREKEAFYMKLLLKYFKTCMSVPRLLEILFLKVVQILGKVWNFHF